MTLAGSGIGSGSPPPLNPKLPKSVLPVLWSPPSMQLPEMVFVSIVTAPVLAKARPQRILALVFNVILSRARMFPANAVLVPRVAELPTTQYKPTLLPPLITFTVELLAVVKVLPS